MELCTTSFNMKDLLMNLKIILTLLLLLLLNSVKAQTCCSGGIPLSNNIGMAILEEGTTQIGISYDFNNLYTLNNGSEELDDDARLCITY